MPFECRRNALSSAPRIFRFNRAVAGSSRPKGQDTLSSDLGPHFDRAEKKALLREKGQTV
jgi:hypothetical protein